MGIGDGPMGHSDFTVVVEGSQNLDPGQDLNESLSMLAGED